MAPDGSDHALEEVAARFSGLWRALTLAPDGPHPPEIRQMLIDRVRDALDRGEARLLAEDKFLVANTFMLEQMIHDGPATQIYRARHRDLGTLHAVKTTRSDQVDDATASGRLLREGRIGMQVRHRNVVPTQTVLRLADGRPALVLEYVDQSLADVLHNDALNGNGIREVMKAVLHGLDAIHAAGFVHCDLSPANILIDGNDMAAAMITDFGISLPVGQRHSDFDLAFAGRRDLASPEQLAGEKLDVRSDLYSAGIIMSLLLSRCRDAGDDINGLRELAFQLCARDPADRPATAKASLDLLTDHRCHFPAPV